MKLFNSWYLLYISFSIFIDWSSRGRSDPDTSNWCRFRFLLIGRTLTAHISMPVLLYTLFYWLVKLWHFRSLSPRSLPPVFRVEPVVFTYFWIVHQRKLPATKWYPCFAFWHDPDCLPRFRDKALRGRRPAGDIICMIPPAPPPKLKAGVPDPSFSFPPSAISFPCSLRST